MPHVNPEKALLPLKELHAAFAATVFKAFFCNSTDDDIDPRAPSAPWTLALGALKYRDVYNGLVDYTCNNMSLDSFLRLQVYRVGTYEFEGRRKPLITHIESGTYEKTEALGGDVKIFQPYWLG